MTHSPDAESVDGAAEWTLLSAHFSDDRLAGYLAAAQGDQVAAAELYRWNSRTSATFWESLGHLEVALRNALDHRMTLRQQRISAARHWLFDDARELGRDARGAAVLGDCDGDTAGPGKRKAAGPASDHLGVAVRLLASARRP
jgi:hypothetical protein